MTAVLKLAPQTGPRSLMLAMQTPWDGSVSLRHWWVSEKLDGIRAYWDGEAFWSREGNQFYPPAWFTAQLPKTPLDGELWLGRGRFYECSGVVKRKTPRIGDVAWKEMRYMVFDAPAEPGPFAVRVGVADRAIAGCKVAQLVQQVQIPSNEHVDALLAAVQAGKGEGRLAREPGHPYVSRPSGVEPSRRLPPGI